MSIRPVMSSEEAFQRLIEGNKRYVTAAMTHPNQAPERRVSVAGGQTPFAVVLGCADSRVPPEILFDQGIGDLFVIRVAGNTARETNVLGSIEYAVEHLGTPLVVVLGHEKCGAVTAAVNAVTTNAHEPGNIGHLVASIVPAVEAVRDEPGDLLENAIRANIALTVGQLRSSEPFLARFSQEGRGKIVGAYYRLESGEVVFLD